MLGRKFLSFEIVGEHSVLPVVRAEYYHRAEMTGLFRSVPQEHTVLPYELCRPCLCLRRLLFRGAACISSLAKRKPGGVGLTRGALMFAGLLADSTIYSRSLPRGTLFYTWGKNIFFFRKKLLILLVFDGIIPFCKSQGSYALICNSLGGGGD